MSLHLVNFFQFGDSILIIKSNSVIPSLYPWLHFERFMSGSNQIVGHNVRKGIKVWELIKKIKKADLRIFWNENHYTDYVSSFWFQRNKVSFGLRRETFARTERIFARKYLKNIMHVTVCCIPYACWFTFLTHRICFEDRIFLAR